MIVVMIVEFTFIARPCAVDARVSRPGADTPERASTCASVCVGD